MQVDAQVPVALAEEGARIRSWTGLFLGTGTALLVSFGLVPAGNLIIQVQTPAMTRCRKRELVADLLPTAIPILFVAASLALALGAWRHGSVRRAVLGVRTGALGQQAPGLLVLALVLAFSTPLLQALCGGNVQVTATTLFASPGMAWITLAGVSATALIEDALMRWLPIELFLGLRRLFGGSSARPWTVVAVVLSAALASLAHATPAFEFPSIDAWLRFGVPKAPAAFLFAWLYVRRGIVEAWLVHVLTNLGILTLVPIIT